MAQKALLKSPWLSSASPEANGLALKPYSLNSRLMPFSIEGSSSTTNTSSRVSKMVGLWVPKMLLVRLAYLLASLRFQPN
jgi:hypothetical protein